MYFPILHTVKPKNLVTKTFHDFEGIKWLCSEGQEKYLRELSITPVGYFTGAIKNHSRAVSHGTGTILHGKNEAFQRNRNDFPKVSFTLDVI
jgi:hypothetical protein